MIRFILPWVNAGFHRQTLHHTLEMIESIVAKLPFPKYFSFHLRGGRDHCFYKDQFFCQNNLLLVHPISLGREGR